MNPDTGKLPNITTNAKGEEIVEDLEHPWPRFDISNEVRPMKKGWWTGPYDSWMTPFKKITDGGLYLNANHQDALKLA
jgi:hypothetical protein